MKNGMRVLGVLILGVLLSAGTMSWAGAASQPPINLGTSASYGLLADGYWINSSEDTSTCNGDAGVVGNDGPGHINNVIVTGVRSLDDTAAHNAILDMEAAWREGRGRSADITYTAPFLGSGGGGQVLFPGVYADGHPNSLDVTGTLILDAQGDPNAVWIFQTDDALTTSPGSHIVLRNEARFCRVFWIVGSANLGAGSDFVGHIIALNTITAGHGAFVEGQLLAGADPAQNGYGDVILDGNTITNAICTPRFPRTGYPPAPMRPELPIAIGALVVAAVGLLSLRRRALPSR
jgi:hypothetical protein